MLLDSSTTRQGVSDLSTYYYSVFITQHYAVRGTRYGRPATDDGRPIAQTQASRRPAIRQDSRHADCWPQDPPKRAQNSNLKPKVKTPHHHPLFISISIFNRREHREKLASLPRGQDPLLESQPQHNKRPPQADNRQSTIDNRQSTNHPSSRTPVIQLQLQTPVQAQAQAQAQAHAESYTDTFRHSPLSTVLEPTPATFSPTDDATFSGPDTDTDTDTGTGGAGVQRMRPRRYSAT
ncbi:hypothetical protein EVG20_g6254 [Dentipellis fragilis]|uniref:Uncharacterized protein n=1 Tax=Dentipellis fragilis TaxID=205917 RepID=A0A4Y9YPK3_9AGAM|nr:hypothetical protein EVG20_g6254 [Dentipellis fragilis]